MAGASSMIVMGRVTGPFGLKGWVKVQPFTELLDTLLHHPDWWLGRDDRWDKRRLVDGAVHGRTLTVQLDGCADRDAATRLKGMDVAVPRAELPENERGEYYWCDLIGLEVVNQEGAVLGRVARLLQTGVGEVLVVAGERERLIPFIEPVVLTVDFARQRLTVDWGEDF